MKMILLGTGTSHGVPVIGCSCRVYTSRRPENKRLRCSAYVKSGHGKEQERLLIDTGPEFRIQAIKYQVKAPQAVFITHSHADHLNGLDDLRIFSHTKAVDPSHPEKAKLETAGEGLPIYTNSICIKDIKNRFDYIFMPVKEGGGKPKLNLIDVKDYSEKNPVKLRNLYVIPIPLIHGSLPVTGYLICRKDSEGQTHSIAYLTDTSFIPEESFTLIKENCGILEHLVIDGLRVEKHSTHFSFEEALEAAEKLTPRHTWLTHITHNMSHRDIQHYVKKLVEEKFPGLKKICREGGSVSPAKDGLVLKA